MMGGGHMMIIIGVRRYLTDFLAAFTGEEAEEEESHSVKTDTDAFIAN